LKNKSQARKKTKFSLEKIFPSPIFTLGNKKGHAQSILFVKSVDGNMENVI
jgi:hypothetical protein